MADVSAVIATWQGFTGAPGYSKFYFDGRLDAPARQAAGNLVYALFDGVKAHFKSTWSITVNPIVQSFDIGTGDLTGEAAMGTPLVAVIGTSPSTTPYAGGVGYVIRWHTGGIHNGRKTSGRTFMVPAVEVADQDGTIKPGVVTTIITAGNNLVNGVGASFGIYTRDWRPGATPDDPPIQDGGVFTEVTSCSVPDRSAVLRSRRQ